MKDILGLMFLPLTIPLIIIALVLLQVKVMWQIVKDWRKTHEKTRLI